MAKQVINVGTADLAGDGDALRTAFTKVNDNFTELYDDDAQDITLASFSVGAEGTPSGDGAIAYNNSTGVFTYTPPASTTAISNVVEDTTPQLGGDLDTNGNKITFADSVNAEFGADGDLKIFHNGSHSIVRETGTGSLYLQSDNNVILSTDSGTKKMIKGVGSGAVELYHNDVLKLNTSTSGVTVVDELHTEGATPHLTLKRTDNANVPTLRFKGSGGVIGASIDFDGTAGNSNELAFQTYDGVSLAERFRVGHTGVTIAGTLNGHTIPAGAGTIALTSDITGSGISNVVEDTTPQLGGDLDGQAFNITTTGKILYANVYAQLADLPSATTYHGMFAHVHATGAGYFAHGGNWIQLANYTDLSPYLPTANLNTNIDLHLNQASAGSNQVLSWDGADYAWVNQSGGGGSSNVISQGNTNVTVTDTGSDGNISFTTEGTGRWSFTNAGHLLPAGNASYDIGSADYKVRHLFLSDNSLKFIDASDVEHALGVSSGKLQFKTKDVIISSSTANQLIDVSGAGLGISIGTASTSGSTISIGAEVNDTSVNMNGVTEFGAKAIFNRGVHEKFLTITGATGVVAHNVQSGHVFLHKTPAANWTANFTNLVIAQEDATNIAIIIDQGNTAYMPTAVQIDGVAQTIVWQGNSTPTGTDNGKNVVSFTILNDVGTYVVLGQSTSFGGV